MTMSRMAGAPLTVRMGNQDRTFRRLSRRDFAVLIERMPVAPDQRLYMTPFDVHRWAATTAGSVLVLSVSSLPTGATGDQLNARVSEISPHDEQAEAWGSLIQQATVAAHITAESLMAGDEPPVADSAEDEKRLPPTFTGTGPTKPG